ncbi:hypothetical protein L208DRAFT_1375251 [Tricholoma matsutake]|nr:hypothetical protein L208DRAFT_1375251 [Tricholoma matsutake 945]
MCDWKHHWPECDHIGRKLFDTHAVFVEHAKMWPSSSAWSSLGRQKQFTWNEGSAIIGTTGIHFVVKFVGPDVTEGPSFKVVSARWESWHSILWEFKLLLDCQNDMKNGVAKFSILFGDGVEFVSSCHFFEDVVLKEKAQIAAFASGIVSGMACVVQIDDEKYDSCFVIMNAMEVDEEEEWNMALNYNVREWIKGAFADPNMTHDLIVLHMSPIYVNPNKNSSASTQIRIEKCSLADVSLAAGQGGTPKEASVEDGKPNAGVGVYILVIDE